MYPAEKARISRFDIDDIVIKGKMFYMFYNTYYGSRNWEVQFHPKAIFWRWT